MEIYIYLLTPGRFRVLIAGSHHAQLFKGVVEASSEIEALTIAFEQMKGNHA